MRVAGLSFRFRPTAEQQADLDKLLEDQQDPRSPLYHSWLTPEQFGERFGLSTKDLAAVREWIVSEGFQVDQEARSRTYVSFSGTASQVRKTFGTELHRFHLNGKARYSNLRDAEVPAQIEGIVFSLQGLNDFPLQNGVTLHPQVNNGGGHSVGPADLATIYNVNALYAKGITGTGQKIAVLGQTALRLSDIQGFRMMFGLPNIDLKLILVPGMGDPGVNGDLGEALLDIDTAGGIAPNATILFVYAPQVEDAETYAIDQNLAPVISESYSGCELPGGTGSAMRSKAQQAVAQGITWIANTGDTGPAGCEYQAEDYFGASGMLINGPASTPEVTAVGGTTLAEGGGNYWSTTEKDGRLSALSYIPETAWNDTTNGSLLTASSGGTSIFFSRPSWQTGPGVPNDNARHTPDVAFAASWWHDPYMIIKDGQTYAGGGTSASTPLFAGIVALLNQYVVSSGIQSKPGLGNINPRLYQLAQSGRGVFHDITTGNNIIPCKTGTRDCYTGTYGYKAGAGYDMVTGLGSIDVGKLAENWAVSKSNPQDQSAVVPSVSPSPVYQQAPDSDGYGWYYEVKLEETGGVANTITSFSIDGYDLSSYIDDWFGSATLPAHGTLSASLRSKDVKVPVDRVFAFGGVDAKGQRWTRQISVSFLGAQKSAAISLTSTPSTVVLLGSSDPNCTKDHPYYQQLNLQELNGFDVTLTKFYALGNDYSANISSWFGSLRLPALGTLHARLCWTLNTVPTTVSYEIHGVDKSGRDISSELQVQFKSLDQKSGGITAPTEITLSAQGSQSASTTIPVNVPSTGRWSVTVFPANQRSSWLVVSPQSGQGPGTITVTASAVGLANGTYNATVVIESPDTSPQFVNVPVTFKVGASASTVITGMQNAASYESAFAPGMLAAVYGNHLANSSEVASGSIPLSLAGVSATVNGIAAPLWYVSPGLINLQIPYETPVGTATLVVNNNGQVNSFEFPVRATAPGIFGGLSPAARGATIAVYLTGEGELNPLLETGSTPDPSTTVENLPRPRASLSVTVGGRDAQVVFAGNPWLVGVLQVNFTIPADVPLGPQSVVVTIGDKSSKPVMLTVR